MEITKAQAGDFLEVKIRGRLDGYWADDLSRMLMESVREGAHHIRLDMQDIDFMSSVGLGVLIDAHQRIADIHGSFSVMNPSKQVRKLLELSGVAEVLMAQTTSVTSTPVQTLQKQGLRVERDNFSLEVFDCVAGSKLKGRVMGQPELINGSRYRKENCLTLALPESTMAIGLGALGEGFDECRTRFGEFLAAGGSTAYQPTDGSGVPDYMKSAGTFIPSIQMLYGIVCEGAFSQVAHFNGKDDARPVTLSDLATMALELASAPVVGMVTIAESAGLLGAWLRRSPAVESAGKAPFGYPEIREWLSFASERVHHRSMVLIAGVATRAAFTALDPFVRPLWRDAFPAGHFHGAAFSYRPLKKGETDLKRAVTTLFVEETLQSVLHLLSDDREAEGTGQSEFLRGACWFGPVELATAEAS